MAPIEPLEDASSFQPRAYQLEMLDESLRRNIIVAMDTGSGKTMIAILRIRIELERCSSKKAVWFLCPTVALAEQQLGVLQLHLPSYPAINITSKDGVDTWTTSQIWEDVLRNVDIIVCTHQVLLDALIHGFVSIVQIALLVFDEAHHCVENHPANSIMQQFYHPCKKSTPQDAPYILGLTASPVARKKLTSLVTIEQNLDAISKTPRLTRPVLMQNVHRPTMSTVFYANHQSLHPSILVQLASLYDNLNIFEDPYVISLQGENPSLYTNTIMNKKTYCQKQMKDFVRKAIIINEELGPWCARRYISDCIKRFRQAKQQEAHLLEGTDDEKAYLHRNLSKLENDLMNIDTPPVDGELSAKVVDLIAVLAEQMHTESACIVFATKRVDVGLLSIVLSSHPVTRDLLKVGTFVGSSSDVARKSRVGDFIHAKGQAHTLQDLRCGNKNLIVCTSVCEEGIDISACNLVVCFDAPPNLKSFIQRRGRARSTKSSFVLMLPKQSVKSQVTLNEWLQLEKLMEEQYMNEMREVKEKTPELEQDFVIESTGVTLPNTVDSSLREFSGVGMTMKVARQQVSFDAYRALYHAGLVNDHLLPFPVLQDEDAEIYAKVAKRPNLVQVHGQYDPWSDIAAAWKSTWELYQYVVHLTEGDNTIMTMRMLAPIRLPPLSSNIVLYIASDRALEVHIIEQTVSDVTPEKVEVANEITNLLLSSIYPRRMQGNKVGFPLLFVPPVEDETTWLQHAQETYPATDLLLQGPTYSEISMGIIRDVTHYAKPYILDGIEQRPLETMTEERADSVPRLRCRALPSRRDFLHPVPTNLHPNQREVFSFLDPATCEVDRLPYAFARFALLIPSIMHRLGTLLMTSHISNNLLGPVCFSNAELVLPALSTASAQEGSDYQRLEFLGDSILKTVTALSLMAGNPKWHEGYLSNRKDHIVSNGRLALAAQKTGLDKYILTRPFTGQKWRPLYNEDLLAVAEPSKREMSTKTLADVVEAIIGAAFLDGGFPEALCALSVFLPEVSWQPLERWCASLLAASLPAESDNGTSYAHLERLELLLGHTFTHKSFLLEAITHPSFLSPTSPTPSYQRLEFLGDALLDYIITTFIFSATTSNNPGHAAPQHLRVPRMHLLRTASVNAAFLGFCALSTTTSVATTVPIKNADVQSTNPDRHAVPTFQCKTTHLSLLDFLRAAPSLSLISTLEATRTRFATLQQRLELDLAGPTYPWRALAALAPDKVVSDMVEAVLAAVYLDTGGSFEACERVLRRFGILQWVQEAVEKGRKVWHPKEEVGWRAAGKEVEYVPWKEEEGDGEGLVFGRGRWRCGIRVGGEEMCVAQGWTRSEVETAAAEEAVRILRERGLEPGEAETETAAQVVEAGVGRKRRRDGVDEDELDAWGI